jgi:hypothetical protein
MFSFPLQSNYNPPFFVNIGTVHKSMTVAKFRFHLQTLVSLSFIGEFGIRICAEPSHTHTHIITKDNIAPTHELVPSILWHKRHTATRFALGPKRNAKGLGNLGERARLFGNGKTPEVGNRVGGLAHEDEIGKLTRVGKALDVAS